MTRWLRWAIENTPAMNTLMVAVMAIGALSLWFMRREVFPEFDLEIVLVRVPYPGASPDEVEQGICQKIEEAVRAVDGIKKQTSVAGEGQGTVVLELETGTDAERVLNEVRSEVDRIPSFPILAEDPEVEQLTLREAAIQVGLVGPPDDWPGADWQLRDMAEEIRDGLIQLPQVSQANIVGAKEYQIDIEISEETLRRYGLSLQRVAGIVRRENLEIPGGTIRTDAQEVLVRGKNKRLVGTEIEKIPLVTQPGGVVLTVGDLGRVRDDFADVTSFHVVDGRPAMVISVDRTKSEDLLAMTAAVKQMVADWKLPIGYDLMTWADQSVDVRDRLELLTRNGAQGLFLVLLVLALFLNTRLAFWVALGIPISILGACGVLWWSGETLNMLTMFAFLMALGIVVDDAIVIGENIFTHRGMGKNYVQAAVDGAIEVLPSVMASVSTTLIAFTPLLFVSGVMGKFIAVLPMAMIAMLIISLLESMFILPCHLAHKSDGASWADRARRWQARMDASAGWLLGAPLIGLALVVDWWIYPFRRLGDVAAVVNRAIDGWLKGFVARFYLPALRFSLRNPAIVLASSAALLLVVGSLVTSGVVPYVLMPKLDANTVMATINFPDGTPSAVTDEATRRLERTIRDLDQKYRTQGSPIVELSRRSVGFQSRQEGPGLNAEASGSHLGGVTAELVDTTHREIDSETILAEWRQAAGDFPGAESLQFGSRAFGPSGSPIEFKLLADAEQMGQLEDAVERTKARLAEYPGVFDIRDDSRPGKWEFQLRVKERAMAMGVPLGDLAETVRAAYYGEEVMRLQRGRHEVKLMVRYPREDRRSLAEFDQIRVRTGIAAERPLTELADVRVERGYSEINRVNQLRSITIRADVDESLANADKIVEELQATFMPGLLKDFPTVSVRWEGQKEQSDESIASLKTGFGIALIAMFVLLTLQFRSYVQPVIILAIIPFGMVGAVAGHALLGMPLTLFSVFGLVALTGVIVNDSIVLIDFINHRVRDGIPLREALLDAGRRRFRPVLLTSITTIAGLTPLLLETSFQAQILIPMATSLSFGLLFGTFLVLLLVPTMYQIYGQLVGLGGGDEPMSPVDQPAAFEPAPEQAPLATAGSDR